MLTRLLQPLIPFTISGYKDVTCNICHFQQPLENRPDVKAMANGGGGGGNQGGGQYGPPSGPPPPQQGWGQQQQGWNQQPQGGQQHYG